MLEPAIKATCISSGPANTCRLWRSRALSCFALRTVGETLADYRMPVFRFREQVDKLEKAKVELMREMLQSASEIVAFKEEVSQNLQYLLDTAEST